MARAIISQEQIDFPKACMARIKPSDPPAPSLSPRGLRGKLSFPFFLGWIPAATVRYFPKQPIIDGNDADPAIEGLQQELH